jgi:hypothetical protein
MSVEYDIYSFSTVDLYRQIDIKFSFTVCVKSQIMRLEGTCTFNLKYNFLALVNSKQL